MPKRRCPGGTGVRPLTIVLPAISIAPSPGDSKPAIMRRRVVLPPPLGPRSAISAPRPTLEACLAHGDRGPKQYEYRLLLTKQPGIDSDRVSVRVQLPEGARVVTTSPPSVRSSGSTVTWEGTLVRDTELVIVFESP